MQPIGRARTGAPPPLDSLVAGREGGGPSPVTSESHQTLNLEGGAPAGMVAREEAGFWDQVQPRICSNCQYKTGDSCSKVEGVNYLSESDPDLAGCSLWEAGEGMEEDAGEDEETEGEDEAA